MPVAPLITAWRQTHRNLPGPTVMGQEALPVTFPATRLVSKVLIALGADLSADPLTWAWQDITQWVRFDLGISLTTGRRDESSVVQPGQGVLKLDNRDGRFSRRNPTGPYYGLLSKNTPIWITVDAGAGEKTRMEMCVNEWPTRWSDKAATDCTVTIRCGGILRRLQQGAVLKTPLRGAILGASPSAYWPMEDGPNATLAGSGLDRGTALAVASGTVNFSGGLVPVGALQAIDLSAGGTLGGSTGIAAGVSTGWECEVNLAFDPFPSGNPVGNRYTVLQIETPGSAYRSIGIVLINDIPTPTTFNLGLFYVDTSGVVSADYSTSPGPMVAGQIYNFRMVLFQSGGNIAWRLYQDGVQVQFSSFLPATLYAPTYVTVNASAGSADPKSNPACVSHLAIWTPSRSTATSYQAVDGYSGEMAHVRAVRLCAEQGVLFETVASTSATMGPQTGTTLLNLLRECETADGGVLYEKRWGLAYQSLAERYNAAVGLALDFDQGHVAELPEPADDDQRTRNRWTVSRTDGSEYTAEETSGPMGTGSEGPGLYDDSATVNTETDNQLSSQAGWRVHLGTVDEDRWPGLDLNFTRNPGLIDEWTALGYGARITVDNPPVQMPQDDLDLVIEGHGERLDPYLWTASLTASSFSPYRVVVVGSTAGNLGRVDAANSTLAADATSTDTTISVASPGALWRTGAVSFDIGVGGEQMTVTNIAGGTSPQTFTVTRSVNGVVKAQPATVGGRAVKVSLWKPAVYAL